MSRFSVKNRPRDPTVETIETFNIPLNYRLTLGENGANFIIHRVSIHNPQHDNRFEGYIVLGDPQLIVQLRRRSNARKKKSLPEERRKDTTIEGKL